MSYVASKAGDTLKNAAGGALAGAAVGGPLGAIVGGVGGAGLGLAGQDVVGSLLGEDAAEASLEGARIQGEAVDAGILETQRASAEGQGFLGGFEDIKQSGIDQAGFLTDPQAQFDFLQNNPLFKSALENANRETTNLAASRGRLSAGDTLQQLSNNVLLSASPLIQQQKQSIGDLLNLGTGISQTQANVAIGQGSNITDLITSGGAVEAAGVVGAGNARTQGFNNLLSSAILAGGIKRPPPPPLSPSDKKLKENINKIGSINGFNIYSWTWNTLAKTLGLNGDSFGVLAQEVMEINPDAVTQEDGVFKVNYDMIGLPHGSNWRAV